MEHIDYVESLISSKANFNYYVLRTPVLKVNVFHLRAKPYTYNVIPPSQSPSTGVEPNREQ